MMFVADMLLFAAVGVAPHVVKPALQPQQPITVNAYRNAKVHSVNLPEMQPTPGPVAPGKNERPDHSYVRAQNSPSR